MLRICDCRFPIADFKKARSSTWNLFEQLHQILKHGVFFVGARAIGDKELLAQVQCLSLHCSGTKPIPYRSQESISVSLIFLSRSGKLLPSYFLLLTLFMHAVGYFRVTDSLRSKFPQ